MNRKLLSFERTPVTGGVDGNTALSPRFLLLKSDKDRKPIHLKNNKADYVKGKRPASLTEAIQNLSFLVSRVTKLLPTTVQHRSVQIDSEGNRYRVEIINYLTKPHHKIILELERVHYGEQVLSTLTHREGAFSRIAAEFSLEGKWNKSSNDLDLNEHFSSSLFTKNEAVERLFFLRELIREALWIKLSEIDYPALGMSREILSTEWVESEIENELPVLDRLHQDVVRAHEAPSDWQVLKCSEKEKSHIGTLSVLDNEVLVHSLDYHEPESYILRNRDSKQAFHIRFHGDECSLQLCGITLLKARKYDGAYHLVSGYPMNQVARLALDVTRLLGD